jgi:hypothetical protein
MVSIILTILFFYSNSQNIYLLIHCDRRENKLDDLHKVRKEMLVIVFKLVE